jgi:DNA-binding transcriptional ArsR family regulator
MAVETTVAKKGDRFMPAMAEVREHVTEAAAFLKALANDQRLLVLCALIDGPLSVGEINERVPLSQSALSQHLTILREAELVTTSRQSQTIYYTLARGPALQIMQVLYATFCSPTATAPRKKGRCKPSRRS